MTKAMHIALHEPEIPPNTGNIMRLCANTGTFLHLIRPLGFELDDRQLRRAGLDYRDTAKVSVYDDWVAFSSAMEGHRIFACTTRGRQRYDRVDYDNDDVLLFGAESRGLPQGLLDEMPADRCVRIPMQPDSRSMNLSNAAAVILYEALRQQGFPHLG